MKTAIRKEIDQELSSKLLLNDASGWQVTKHLLKQRSVQVSIALVVGAIVGKIL